MIRQKLKIYCSILELKEHFKKRWEAIFTDNITGRWTKEEMYLLKRGLQDHLALKNWSKKGKSLILQQKIFWKKQVKASCLKCKYQRHSWHIWKVIMFINKKNIDLNIVFQYPLLSEPQFFVHPVRESKKLPVIPLFKRKKW